MITSIFSKSKPINFVIVFFITLLAFIIAKIKLDGAIIKMTYIIEQASLFFICYISILTLNFIVGKNNLTQKNNYEILLFSLFLGTIPQTMLDSNIILANFFVLLALRRIISLRSQIDVKKKLFDAAFWITIASLFYFWAILFFILILATLLFYTDNRIKNWIIPFMGSMVVLIITGCYSMIAYDNFFAVFNMSPEISYDFSMYNTIQYIVAVTILLSFGLWSTVFYLKVIKKKMKKFKGSFKTILVAALIAFLIVVVSPEKKGSEFLFLFAPLAIIITNYIETIKERWFKEVFLFILFGTPIILLML
jgi:hypothetical protein